MSDEIELTETKPGLWEFVRRKFSRSVPSTLDDRKAREEAFFNSLGTTKKRFSPPIKYRLFWLLLCSSVVAASAFFIYHGAPELVIPVLVIVGLFPGMIFVIELCHGASWSEAFRATVRPHSD